MKRFSIGMCAAGIFTLSASVQAATPPRFTSAPSTTTVTVSNAIPSGGETIRLSAKVTANALGLYQRPSNDQIGGYVDFKVNGQPAGRVQVSTNNTVMLGEASDLNRGCWAALRDKRLCTYYYAFGREANVAVNYVVPAGFTTQTITATFTGDANFSVGSTSAPVSLSNIPTFGEIRGLNNKCLDAENAGTAPGTAIQVWQCTEGTVQQLWTVQPGSPAIKGVHSGRVLDIVGYGTTNGSRVQLYDAHGDFNQTWKFTSTAIVGISNKVLDATGMSSDNGTKIQLYDSVRTDNQLWNFDPVTGQITGIGGKCLDVEGANTADGALVQLWDCSGVPQQRFELGGNGTVRGLGGKCLESANGAASNGNAIRMWSCNGGAHQSWRLVGEIRNPQSNLCLDDPESGRLNGTKVHMWYCSGGLNQRWEFSSY